MAHNWLNSATFVGPALPSPFVEFELERELSRLNLLPQVTGASGKQLKHFWDSYRRKLNELRAVGGEIRVRNHVLEPLLNQFGYSHFAASEEVATREGLEPGGTIATSADGARLRVFSCSFEDDL